MAEINIEKKKSVWPWIVAAIVVLLLIWLLFETFDRDDDVVGIADPALVTTPVYTDPATDTTMPATDATAAMMTDSDMARFTGMYTSNNMQLNLDANGTYMMQESAAGEGRGTWVHDASANALHLTPADGTADRYFRVESADTLIPLNSNGEPADQMAMLTRQGVAAE
jgi:hypothetical protein